ncbi:MAG: hypothetical protein J5674_05055 [Candidatus Methanomethylophilaceae archaeon]|nr:hypothetical protein [Candidatus Methanomethylophilaceae archaeon]
MNTRTMGAISAGVLLLAVVLGIILYVVTGDALDALWIVTIVFGIYIAATSLFKNGENGFGPSNGDAALVGGILLAGIGVTGLLHGFLGNVLLTVAVFIAIVAAVVIVMAVKNRKV